MVDKRTIDGTGGENPESAQLLDQIGRRMLKRRVDALKSLPTFPESILRINEVLMYGEADQSLLQIARAIEADPVVTARTLRLVNSAFYGVSGAIASVYDALVMLGLDVAWHYFIDYGYESASGRTGVRGLWEHSYGAAVAATALGRELKLPRVEEMSAAALMHDIGKLVLASQLGREYDDVVAQAVRHDRPIRDVEISMLGVSHDVIGQWLASRWRFQRHWLNRLRSTILPKRRSVFPKPARSCTWLIF